jgi:hypothetical protein
MSNLEKRKIDWGPIAAVLAIFVTVLLAVAGGTWAVAQKMQSDELEGYRQSQQANFQETTADLKKYAHEAQLAAADQNELADLRKRLPELESTTAVLRTKLEQTVAERNSLKLTLDSMLKNVQTVEIPLGEAKYIIPNTVALGVVSISTISNSCDVQIAGDRSSINVGGVLPVKFANNVYNLTLLKISESSATFSFTQAQSDKP